MTTRAHSGVSYLKPACAWSGVLLIAFAAVFSGLAWESEKTARVRQLSAAAELGARSLDFYFQHLEIELQELSLDLDDGRGRIDPARAHAVLLRFGKYHSHLRDAAIVAAGGRMVVSAPAPAGTVTPGTACLSWFAQLREPRLNGRSLDIGRAVPAQTGKEGMIPLAYASRDAHGRLRYLICANLPQSQSQRLWDDAALEAGATLGLRRDDTYLPGAGPLPANLASDPIYAAPDGGARIDDLRQQDYAFAGVAEGANGPAESKRLFVSRRLAHYPLSFHASIPASLMRAAWWKRMQYPYALLALLLAAGALACRWMQQRQLAWETGREQKEREARELNLELARRVEELEATKLELESFSYCVAHDLRTPLRGIDGFAYQLRKDYAEQIGEAGRACLDRIRAASRQLGGTMDELLKLSETNLHAFKAEAVDLSALAREFVTGLEADARRPGLQWVIADAVPAEGDVRLLRLALQNLLDNALKFTCGRASARIEFGVWPELREGKTVYFVKDDGAGFDMKDAGKLFRAFERLHPQDAFPGHGIGLAVVQRIVRRHRGQIWAESAPGQGAIFFFTLA